MVTENPKDAIYYAVKNGRDYLAGALARNITLSPARRDEVIGILDKMDDYIKETDRISRQIYYQNQGKDE